MNATIKKTPLTTEQIELNNEKKELKKLTKLIDKAPTKKEIKEVAKIETLEEIKKVSIINDLISFNFEEYLSNKNLAKEHFLKAKKLGVTRNEIESYLHWLEKEYANG